MGTAKGAFLLNGCKRRSSWAVADPLCEGWPIDQAIGDADMGHLWAARGRSWECTGLSQSTDDRLTWARRHRLANAEGCGHSDHPAAPQAGETDCFWL